MIKSGMCPSNLQHPHGKRIPISVIGPSPYVISNKDKEWIGGTEFQIIEIYAHKFGFTPKFIRATSWDSEGGMVSMVGKISLNKLIPN